MDELMRIIACSIIFATGYGAQAEALIYDCRVNKKFDSERIYTAQDLETYRPRVLIDLTQDAAYVRRCSISIINGGVETCDKYKADYAAFDANADVSKFYVFESQFNVQLFSDGSFIEDNGRGTISFGTCNRLVP
jgi:hypothetical protein